MTLHPRQLTRFALLAVSVFTTPLTFGQILHTTGPRPSFEVATIKPAAPITFQTGTPAPGEKVMTQMVFTTSSNRSAPAAPSDRVQLVINASALVGMAYNLPVPFNGRIIGGPEWIDKDSYEIQAKIPEAVYQAMRAMPTAQSRQQRQLMEQSLLADRFHLAMHFETRELPVYALVVDKGGFRLPPATPGDATNILVTGDGHNQELKATSATIDAVARLLQMQPDVDTRLIVDQTGLTGSYNFALKWSREQPGADSTASDAPAFVTALREQLGLRLVPSRAPVEVIVIDHIERPTEN